MDKEKALFMKGICKYFPGVKALQNVDLEIEKGEILALVGENGAGKSTLIKILSGAYSADGGEIYLYGKQVKFTNPKESIAAGVSVMYQELNNVDQLTIAENIFLGKLPQKRAKIVDYTSLRKNTQELLDQVGLKCDPFTEVARLSIAEKQMVEIAKALSNEMKILVMDEPTAALNKEEINILFKLIKKLSSEGKSIIYISHRLDEVFEISDKVEIMRDGRKVAMLNTAATNKKELVALMVGKEITDLYPKKAPQIGEVVFEVEGLCTQKVADIGFCVKKGEIVGLFGLMGSGRQNIAEAIFGAITKVSGKIKMNGKEVRINSPADAKKYGISYIPSDRKKDGLFLAHPVAHNITITIIDKLKKFRMLQLSQERTIVNEWVKKLAVKTPAVDTIIETLSGGNQQKAVIAKWLATHPQVLILNEPTRGIDVGAKAEIYLQMEKLSRDGLATIMISSELPEIMAMSDRIYVLHEGRITGEVVAGDFTQEALLSKAIGGI